VKKKTMSMEIARDHGALKDILGSFSQRPGSLSPSNALSVILDKRQPDPTTLGVLLVRLIRDILIAEETTHE
jgi:hypothetical protein